METVFVNLESASYNEIQTFINRDIPKYHLQNFEI